MADEAKGEEAKPTGVRAAEAEEAQKEGPGGMGIGLIVFFIVIIVVFGLLIGWCGRL